MDCFTLLKQDHDEVRQLFKQCESQGAKEGAKKVFQELARNLAVHAKLEEALFYPRLEDEKAVSDLVEEAYEEHEAVEELLAEMASMSPQDEAWAEKLEELKQNVEHHVKEEEGELFPKAAKIIDKDEAADLGETMAEEKKDMLKGSHGAAKDVFERLGL
ncbi:MAG TPA: hemerythrin domain-containing protein [Burkholderiales bacterium]